VRLGKEWLKQGFVRERKRECVCGRDSKCLAIGLGEATDQRILTAARERSRVEEKLDP
jgi:hypothetical protein